MTDQIDELLVEVRASTAGFTKDINDMRKVVDTNLLDGFGKAGDVLERGIAGAIRSGNLGFDDLKRVAFSAFDQIASQAIQLGLDEIFGGSSGKSNGSVAGVLGGLVGSVLGLPGRATGGPVSPGRGYVVGERGPELFVPTSAGRVEPSLGGAFASGAGRDVRVSISLPTARGGDAPRALQRSSRQVASAVRRALFH